LKEDLSNFEYLATLSEDFLYKNFMSLWPTNLDMSDLSQDDKVAIINLKLRYLTSLQHTPGEGMTFLGPDESVRAHMKVICDKLDAFTKEH